MEHFVISSLILVCLLSLPQINATPIEKNTQLDIDHKLAAHLLEDNEDLIDISSRFDDEPQYQRYPNYNLNRHNHGRPDITYNQFQGINYYDESDPRRKTKALLERLIRKQQRIQELINRLEAQLYAHNDNDEVRFNIRSDSEKTT